MSSECQVLLLGLCCHSSLDWNYTTFHVLDIDEDFKKELAQLVPLLLAPSQLVEKEIGGNKVTCKDLLEYFKVVHNFK